MQGKKRIYNPLSKESVMIEKSFQEIQQVL